MEPQGRVGLGISGTGFGVVGCCGLTGYQMKHGVEAGVICGSIEHIVVTAITHGFGVMLTSQEILTT